MMYHFHLSIQYKFDIDDRLISLLRNRQIDYLSYVKDGFLNIHFDFNEEDRRYDSWLGDFARLLSFLSVKHDLLRTRRMTLLKEI